MSSSLQLGDSTSPKPKPRNQNADYCKQLTEIVRNIIGNDGCCKGLCSWEETLIHPSLLFHPVVTTYTWAPGWTPKAVLWRWQGSTPYWMMFLPLNSCSLFLLIHSQRKNINTPLPSEISKKKNNVLSRSSVARWIYMDLSVQKKCNLFYILL